MKKSVKTLLSAFFVAIFLFAVLYVFIGFAEWEPNISHWHWWSRTIIAISCGLAFLYVLGSDD